MRILLKVTSRQRPKQLLNCIRAVIERTSQPEKLQIVYSFDDDDAEQPITELSKLHSNSQFHFDKRSTKIAAINRNVPDSDWDVLVNLSDDQICVANDWDDWIRSAMPKDLDASLWYFDGIQYQINTMEIVGRKYYERDGFIYHPGFKSFFCDNLKTDHAILRERIKISKFMLFKHEHGGNMGDDLYRANHVHWHHDEQLYKSLKP
jgi:hypothetical protein